MQNRTNRGLLFGARASNGATDPNTLKDGEALESDNQTSIEHLRGSASTMKDIALQIDTSVNDQNKTLDRMDKRFENANSLISNTLNALNHMVNDRTSSKICSIVFGFFVALLILYKILRSS